MEQAGKRLAEAEEAAVEHQKRALRDPATAHRSRIYPVGAEYALVHAETQLMSAVIGVLNESLIESLRGFSRLRKAFGTLQEIIEAENRYLENHLSSSSTSLPHDLDGRPSGSEVNSSGILTPAELSEEQDSDLEFADAEEGLSDHPTPVDYQGHVDLLDRPTSKLNGSSNSQLFELKPDEVGTTPRPSDPRRTGKMGHDDLDFTTITSNPIDLFIHAGTALCFGLLQLLLSMIPPAFSRILSIFSFRGDRENGLRLLWKATAFKENINGAMAGLITLGFHNAAVGVCDIHSREAYPAARLHALLQDMRKLYPDSLMWILEEAREQCAQRRLERGVEILLSNSVVSPLKQLEALRVFETSLVLMFLHRYEECAESFVRCVGLNNWSPRLYLYIAGCCHVELYRIHRDSDAEKAYGHKERAKKLLHEVSTYAVKKRFMARELPLDTFINRKLSKWQEAARHRSCDLVDAIGVSPIEEMGYFWAGPKRMDERQLSTSLERLQWSAQQPHWKEATVDERAVHALLQAAILRNLGRVDEAKALLLEGVYCYEWHQIKACSHADNWPLPVAHYEMAVCYWQEAGGQDGDRSKLQQCSEEIARVERWESFDLDARLGLKVTTARETLRRIGVGSA